MIMMATTTKPTMKLITNEEGGEGETGGKTTQVRDHHKLRLHCLFDLGFGLFGCLAYLPGGLRSYPSHRGCLMGVLIA